MKVNVSTALMQRVVNYLETKPHLEVSKLIIDIVKECNSPSEPEAPEEKVAE